MWKLFTQCLFFLLNGIYTTSVNSEMDFKVWGPGLQPHVITMPARYFFIESLNNSVSCAKTDLHVELKGITSQSKSCRIWTDVLQRRECSYIVRYKLYETCENLELILQYKNNHIANSPYLIKDEVHPDDCDCPEKDINTWLKKWECEEVPTQISDDLKKFNKINFNELRQKVNISYNLV